MKSADLDCSTYDSVVGSWTESLSSLVAKSVTTTLRAALAMGLTLTDQAEDEDLIYTSSDKLALVKAPTERDASVPANRRINPEPPDFSLLHARCEGDNQLILEVLRCFCEQGQSHLHEMNSATKDMDMKKLVFHATFLADSASNVGAWHLQGRCLVLCQVASSIVLCDPASDVVLRLLVEQVEEAFGFFLGAVIARAHIKAAAIENKGLCDWEEVHLFDAQHTFESEQGNAASTSIATSAHDISCCTGVQYCGQRPSDSEHVKLVDAPNLATTCVIATREEPVAAQTPRPLHVEHPLPGGATDSALAVPDKQAASMANLFRRLRRRLDRLRRYNRTARYREAREQAAAMLGAAAAAGCRRIARRAARVLGQAGYMAVGTLDELELQIDTAEAAWRTCRTLV